MTTQTPFEKALAFTLKWEGGYVNDPRDPGGATNYGITQTTFSAWQRLKGLALRSVAKITRREVGEIYRERYWNACRCDEIPSWEIAVLLFDFAVHSGPKRAIRRLQSIIGAEADGIIGPETLGHLRRISGQPITTGHICGRYLAERLSFLRCLSTWRHYGRGWSRRLRDLAALVGVKTSIFDGQ